MSDVSVMCRECWTLVSGVEAGDAVRWTLCPACESEAVAASVVLAVDPSRSTPNKADA